jgi:serine/threonine protein kinase
MAPEVCKGEHYGTKADIWTIGCIIYELAMLRKPFEGNNYSSVFNDIINKKIDVPDSVDTDIKMLIL